MQFIANIWGLDEAGMKAAGKAADNVVWVLGQSQWGSNVPGMKVFREISNNSDPTGKAYRPVSYPVGACQALYLASAMTLADKAGKLNGPGIKEALETFKDFVPYGTDGMCPAVTWTGSDHRSVDKITIGRAHINGETDQGEIGDLVEKGVLKIETLGQVKVERRPDWLGF